LTDYERKGQELKIEMQRLEDHAESLKDALETTGDGQLDALKLVLEELKDEVRNHQLSLEEGKSAVTDAVQKVKNTRRDLSKKVQELAALQQKCKVAKEEQRHVEDKRHQIIGQKNMAISRIDGDKRLRDRIRERHDQMVAKVLQSIESASIITPRVPVDDGETTDSLGAKVEKLKADLQRYSNQ
jgi:ATP-dependent RNA helicase DDX6/DHH1